MQHLFPVKYPVCLDTLAAGLVHFHGARGYQSCIAWGRVSEKLFDEGLLGEQPGDLRSQAERTAMVI